MKSYKGIRKILKNQIKNNSNLKWAWKRSEKDEEFNCVFEIIPKWSSELYTAQQLLTKIDESNNSI